MVIGKIDNLMSVLIQINAGNAKERVEQGEIEAKEEAERLGASPSSKAMSDDQ